MSEEKTKFRRGLYVALTIVITIWIVKLIELSFGISFVKFGILPRQISGLIGIVTFPFIHANFEHLLSNSFPILFLVPAIFYFYPSAAPKVLILIYILSGVLLWFIGRESYHIGASGFIYGLVTFTFFSGVIRWDRRSIVLSLIVTFLYGGFTWGVLPIDSKISWEGHLSGAFIGIVCAFLFRKSDPYDKFAGMEEDEFNDEININ